MNKALGMNGAPQVIDTRPQWTSHCLYFLNQTEPFPSVLPLTLIGWYLKSHSSLDEQACECKLIKQTPFSCCSLKICDTIPPPCGLAGHVHTTPGERAKFNHIFQAYKSRWNVIIRSMVYFISKRIYEQLSPKTTRCQ